MSCIYGYYLLSLTRQCDVSLSNASGKICTIPVARITPAAKDFTMKKRSLSGLSARTDRPRIGIRTPIAPAHRIEAMDMSFSSSALGASLPSAVLVQSQEEEERAWIGRRERKRAKERSVIGVDPMARERREGGCGREEEERCLNSGERVECGNRELIRGG